MNYYSSNHVQFSFFVFGGYSIFVSFTAWNWDKNDAVFVRRFQFDTLANSNTVTQIYVVQNKYPMASVKINKSSNALKLYELLLFNNSMQCSLLAPVSSIMYHVLMDAKEFAFSVVLPKFQIEPVRTKYSAHHKNTHIPFFLPMLLTNLSTLWWPGLSQQKQMTFKHPNRSLLLLPIKETKTSLFTLPFPLNSFRTILILYSFFFLYPNYNHFCSVFILIANLPVPG